MRKVDILGYLFSIAFGFLFFSIGLSRWKDRLSCKDKINATFIKISSDHSFGTTKIWAEFEYRYNGKNYTGHTLDNLSRRELKKFVSGKTYPIYINPNSPKNCRCTKRTLVLEDLILVIFGGFMFFGIILLFLSNLFSYFS